MARPPDPFRRDRALAGLKEIADVACRMVIEQLPTRPAGDDEAAVVRRLKLAVHDMQHEAEELVRAAVAGNPAVRLKWIWRWSPGERRLRMLAITWATGEDSAVEGWHSNQLTFGLTPRLFRWEPEYGGWALAILGLRVHRKRSYGGWFP